MITKLDLDGNEKVPGMFLSSSNHIHQFKAIENVSYHDDLQNRMGMRMCIDSTIEEELDSNVSIDAQLSKIKAY